MSAETSRPLSNPFIVVKKGGETEEKEGKIKFVTKLGAARAEAFFGRRRTLRAATIEAGKGDFRRLFEA